MSYKSSYTRQALAVLELFLSMPEKIQKEIRQLIIPSPDSEVSEGEQLYKLAEEPFADIWDDPANDHWDEFLKEKNNV